MEIPDEEPDASDSKVNRDKSGADSSYIYYKGKGLNINIYHKKTELEKRQLVCDSDTTYNFLRIEVEVKKRKLNTLVNKFALNGRDLSEKILPGLVDILSAYGGQMKDYQKHGVPITDEVLKEIDKL